MKFILATCLVMFILFQVSMVKTRKLGGQIQLGFAPYGDYLAGRLPLINPKLSLAPYATPFNYMPVYGGRFKGVFGDDDYHYGGFAGGNPPVQLTQIMGHTCLNCMNRASAQASQCLSEFCMERTRFDLQKCLAGCGHFR
mmetsp:Transcript_10215/g.14956  ORF Transcript_10215/g.14956 Transcript_10215/m.14956 type:complete len:140 (+) Transcript_10215:1100-1519(+)